MAVVLLTGTLNRVMILELGVPTWLVAVMISLPLVFAPFRALIGFRSDVHRSVLGWRRVPYIWFGTLLQFSGFALMPFALLVLSMDGNAPPYVGEASAAFAFLLVGAGLHTTQTAGLALANDIAPRDVRPRVVALLYVMLLVGMVASSLTFGWVLSEFSHGLLIQVLQGAAVVTIGLNVIALWKQEVRNPALTSPNRPRASFGEAWRAFAQSGGSKRLLIAVGLGTAAFSMQDVLLEPYGGQILNLSVSATTTLTALLALGALAGFAIAARLLTRGFNPHRLAAIGVLAGVIAFSAVIFAAPLFSASLFRAGTTLIGFGSGLFAVGTLTAAMALTRDGQSGLALGAWGAVQATAAGIAIAFGGGIRDVFTTLSSSGVLGAGLTGPSVGYGVVYYLEILLLFATLVAIGPLVGRSETVQDRPLPRLGLADLPT
jgi:BCD family chlorophyll transporter-like MFS transporter